MTDCEPTPALPDLHQADLDPQTLGSLFEDLSACADIFAVIPKTGTGYVAPANISLDEGKEMLLAGQLRGLQIRYKYNGGEWWDTLIQFPDAIRLTRIKHST